MASVPTSPGDASNGSRTYEKRLQELEFVVSHLQKTVDDLNDVVLLQQRKIDMLSRHVEQATSAFQSALNADTTPRSLADDKPPHY
jgi:SlyX protein